LQRLHGALRTREFLVQAFDASRVGQNGLTLCAGEIDASLAQLLFGLQLRDDDRALRFAGARQIDLLL